MMLGEEFDSVIGAARSGAEWAIGALYRELNPALVRYLRSRAALDGDDLASEVWMALAPALATFAGTEQELRRLAFTIAHRRLVDHWRRTRRRAREESTAPQALPEPSTGGNDDVGDLVAGADATSAALSLVREHLPMKQAEIVLLRVVGGLGVDDVAEVLGMRPGTVRVLQHRALKHLAHVLAAPGAGDRAADAAPTRRMPAARNSSPTTTSEYPVGIGARPVRSS